MEGPMKQLGYAPLLFLLLILCNGSPANAQKVNGQDDSVAAPSGSGSPDTNELLKKVDQLVEQNNQLEKQNEALIEQIEALRNNLAKQAGVPTSVSVSSAASAAPRQVTSTDQGSA